MFLFVFFLNSLLFALLVFLFMQKKSGSKEWKKPSSGNAFFVMFPQRFMVFLTTIQLTHLRVFNIPDTNKKKRN